MANSTSFKVKTRDELVKIIANHHSANKRSGYTSGVFDILHAGHVDYLESARSQCDFLIVGINSDISVNNNKGERRPIIGENQRARLIAGLSCVDYVFIFPEVNNNKNIELLKPNVYFKAGDYDQQSLSSAPIVESYGGTITIVPFVSGHSSSAIIEDIIYRYHPSYAESLSVQARDKRPAIFLDRDGTINEPIEYLHEPEKFKLIPGVIDALKKFQAKNYLLVIVTNQPGIGMGYFTKEDYFAVNKTFLKQVSKAGISIDRIYFCPHAKSDNCNCRKPGRAMIDRAVQDLNIDLTKSFVIGDMTGDVMLGKNVGCKTVLVSTGQAGKDEVFPVTADFNVADLNEAADLITQMNN